MEWVKSRALKDSYPHETDDGLHIGARHGVKSYGFRVLRDFEYEYSIKSPSHPQGVRKYTFPFLNVALRHKDHEYEEDFYRFQIGESILRIVVTEYFRRHSKRLRIRTSGFWKDDNGNPIRAENGRFRLVHHDRYNMNVYDNEWGESPLTEYDGVVEYTTSQGQKGIIVCESKTGTIQFTSSQQMPEFRRKRTTDPTLLQKRVVEPLQDLFPDHHIDYLLMAFRGGIYQGDLKTARPRICAIWEILKSGEIGFIPWCFPNRRRDVRQASKDILTWRKAVDPETLEKMVQYNNDQHWIEDGDDLILVNKRRVVRILHHQPDGTWRETYSN